MPLKKAHDLGYLLPIEKDQEKDLFSHKEKRINLLMFGQTQYVIDKFLL